MLLVRANSDSRIISFGLLQLLILIFVVSVSRYNAFMVKWNQILKTFGTRWFAKCELLVRPTTSDSHHLQDPKISLVNKTLDAFEHIINAFLLRTV